MEVVIRRGNYKDLSFIIRLLKEYMFLNISPLRKHSEEDINKSKEISCDNLMEKLRNNNLISFIALLKDTGVPVGFCLIEIIIDSMTAEKEIYINNIGVEKGVMGKMVSNKILKEIEEYAKKNYISVITGDITISNRRSLLFAERYFHYTPEKLQIVKVIE